MSDVPIASLSKPDFVKDFFVVGCASLSLGLTLTPLPSCSQTILPTYITLELRAKPCKNHCCCVLVLPIYGLIAFSSHGFIPGQC